MNGAILNINGTLIDTNVYKTLPLGKVLGAINSTPKPQEAKPKPPATVDLHEHELQMLENQIKINGLYL
jgi:hypothetical protein